MAQFTLNRNHQQRSTSGHTVVFKRGVQTFVPAVMIPEVIALGAERVDAPQAAHIIEAVEPVVPMGPGRERDIRAALDALVDLNSSADFTASGVPKIASVIKVVGYSIDKVELATVWQTRLNELAAA